MNRPFPTRSFFWSILIIVSLVLAVGCAQPAQETRSGTGSMDTPDFHVQRGDDALLQKRYENARRSYKKALELAPANSKALSGLAAATAHEASRPGVSKSTREKTLVEAEKQLNSALQSAANNSEKARVHGFAIQVYYALQLPQEDWYEKARDHFKDAIDLAPGDPAPYFFMGLAEAEGLNYAPAIQQFEKVMRIGGRYEMEANQELKRIQQVQRAMPGSRFGAKIANVEKITRADVAALFIAELKLDRLYQQQAQKKGGSFQAPKSQQKLKLDPIATYPDAVDISGHPLEEAIKEIIKLGVKGLTPDPAHKFHPDKELKRAEFAQLIQDLLIKVTNDKNLATRFIGESTPFPDVNANVWYYNAARTVVSRGLMPINNKVTGAFEPLSPVSGADALLTVRTLKEILKASLRQ